MEATVEHKIIPPGKKLPQDVEMVAGKVKSITLVIPLLEKNAYLILKLPEPFIKEVLEQAEKLPESQRTQFINDWIMKNQDAALQYYLKTKSKVFTLNAVPVRTDSISIGPKITRTITFDRGETKILSGSGTSEDPYQATVAVSPFVRVTGVGEQVVKLPLIISLEGVGDFHFKLTLKLAQLADDNISVTGGSIATLIKQQITELAATMGVDIKSREFIDALTDALSNIAPNIREQSRRLKASHPEWRDCLNGN